MNTCLASPLWKMIDKIERLNDEVGTFKSEPSSDCEKKSQRKAQLGWYLDRVR